MDFTLKKLYDSDPNSLKRDKRYSYGTVVSLSGGILEVDVGATLPDGSPQYMYIPSASGFDPSTGDTVSLSYASDSVHSAYAGSVGVSAEAAPSLANHGLFDHLDGATYIEVTNPLLATSNVVHAQLDLISDISTIMRIQSNGLYNASRVSHQLVRGSDSTQYGWQFRKDGFDCLEFRSVAGGTASTRMLMDTAGAWGLGVTAGTILPYIMSLNGQAARTIGMLRHTTSANVGNNLTVIAGGATQAGALTAASVTAGGSGYIIGEILTITTGGGNAKVVVATVDGSGAVLTIGLFVLGSGYSTGAGQATSGGSGTGCTINITTVKASTDKAGGKLILSGGVGTGTGGSSIELQTSTPAATGSTDNTPTTKMTIARSGNVGILCAPSTLYALQAAGASATATNGGVMAFDTNTGTNDMGIKFGAVAGAGAAGYCFIQGKHTGVASDGNLMLDPVGGKVRIGSATAPGYMLDVTGDIRASTGFGCNSKTPQTAYASGGAVATGAGAFGFASDAERASVTTLLANIRLALVANGIMS